MRYLFVFLICSLSIVEAYSQEEIRQVTIETVIPQVNVAIYDGTGKMESYGKTPFIAGLKVDSVYFYRLRHKGCSADSGYIHVDTNTVNIDIPVHSYMARIHWNVFPSNTHFLFQNTKEKKLRYEGLTDSDTLIRVGKYKLKLSNPEYRTCRRIILSKTDTIIAVSHHLQYCPQRFVVALNVGLASENAMPVGLLMSYGGVHGFYLRYQQTFLNHATGRSFSESTLIDMLNCPYSNCASEYFSAVAGYQYLSSWKFVFQIGAGYGRQSFSWKSLSDGERHTYTPDTSKGVVFDFGLGYPINHFYIGPSVQVLPSSKKSFCPSSLSLNFGVVL